MLNNYSHCQIVLKSFNSLYRRLAQQQNESRGFAHGLPLTLIEHGYQT